jgi:FkbM family methyltransferase
MNPTADLLRKLKRIALAGLRRDLVHRIEFRCRTARFGSEYGGWVVCPDRLTPGAVVYSLGVGEDISFDLSLIAARGVEVWAFDPTPRSVEWVAAQKLPPQFHFRPYAILDYDGRAQLFPPANPSHVSHTVVERTVGRPIAVTARRLSSAMEENRHRQLDLLKMDIEGAEYAVLDDMLRSDLRPAQLVVEFHHRILRQGIGRTRDTIRSLKAHGYRVFAVSPAGHVLSFLRVG